MMRSVVSARTRGYRITEGSWSQYLAVPAGLAIRAKVRISVLPNLVEWSKRVPEVIFRDVASKDHAGNA